MRGIRRGSTVSAASLALAALVALMSPPAAAQPQAAGEAAADTLPGLTWATPDDSASWAGVTGQADLDSLLLGGRGIVLAFEDTFSFDPGTADTVLVSAPRVTVGEVIAAIGRRMEYDNGRIADYEYTTLITQVLRDQPGVNGGDYQVDEIALRFHHDRERGDQRVKLWERTRKYRDHELASDETDDELKADFMPPDDQVIGALPFAPDGASRYNYAIEDRQLVGNNLIYRIGFVPRSRFEALPSGTIWVDYSNWVIRKVEAAMTGAVPYPMFLESVPVYRYSQERFGEYWFPTEVYMQINLRRLPLVPMPDNIEVRVSLRDIVINGVARSPEDAVPGAGVAETVEDGSAEDIAAGFWLSEAANDDSLAAFWGRLDAAWEQDVSASVTDVSLPAARVDSLTRVGSARMAALRAGGVWRVKPDWTRAPGYNRIQGLTPRLGLVVEQPGPDNTRLDLSAGYAFANERPVFGARLELPLIHTRWKLAGRDAAGDRHRGARYQWLALQLDGCKDSALFAGDGRRHTRSFSSFFYGSDPNHYYEERSLHGALKLRLARGLSVRVGGGLAEHRPWAQATDWNLLGRRLRPDGNRQAAALDDRFWTAGAAWHWGALSLDGELTWHEPGAAGSGGGGGDSGGRARREWRVSGALDLLDAMGNQWLLRGAHRQFDGPVPAQWKTWLGDWGTLRGYGAGELTGDMGAQASLDARFGFDLWRALRVPLLKDWGLQPIGFADWGKTWDAPGGAVGPEEGARDWRLDVGFGFGKRFDVPGLGEFRNVRVYAAHGVANGSEGEGWRVLVGFEK